MQWDINPVNSETRRIKGLFCFNRSEGNSIIRPHKLNATDVPFRDNTHTRLENGGTINRAEALRGVHHQGAKSHKRHGEGGGGGKGKKGERAKDLPRVGRVTASGTRPATGDNTEGVADPGGQRMYSKGRQNNKQTSVRLRKNRQSPYPRL